MGGHDEGATIFRRHLTCFEMESTWSLAEQ